MSTRRIRFACVFMLSLLLADTLLAACAGGTSIRRAQEDAMLLMIAGDYQLTGELPALPPEGVSKVARLNLSAFQPPEPTTPNEAWTLFEYYSGLRDAFEQKAKAENLPPDVVAKGIAEYEAKMKAMGDKANELDKRRARHRSTAWKRFFDGLGRFIGRAFDIGGKIVKFAIEDVPTAVGEYTPAVVKGLAQAYVEKLKGELRTKAEQKAFEILLEKNPNLAGAYLIFKAGKAGAKLIRDFARMFGRHRRGTAAQEPEIPAVEAASPEEEAAGAFALPPSGTWAATCDSGRDDSVEAWCEEQGGQLSTDPAFKLTIDFASGTFSFAAKTECVGPEFTNSSSGWTQNTTSEEIQGGGTLYADGWLVGTAKVKALWIEEGVRVKAAGSESYKEGGPTEGTIPLIAYLDGEEDLRALDLYFTSGAYGEVDPVSIEWLREIGWDGVVDWLKGCEACYTVCRPGGAP